MRDAEPRSGRPPLMREEMMLCLKSIGPAPITTIADYMDMPRASAQRILGRCKAKGLAVRENGMWRAK